MKDLSLVPRTQIGAPRTAAHSTEEAGQSLLASLASLVSARPIKPASKTV